MASITLEYSKGIKGAAMNETILKGLDMERDEKKEKKENELKSKFDIEQRKEDKR